MNLRRDRTHHSGNTNLVYSSKSISLTPQDIKSKTAGVFFSSLSKGKRAADVLEKRISRNILSPVAKVQELFESTAGKSTRSKTMVGYPRLAQLEEHEKRKLVFTGESVLIYDRKLEKYRDQDVSIDKIDPVEKKGNLIKEKQKLHGNAIQETQLVGFDNVDTLKNNVNLEKVREARRVLRRRYASRKNLFSIYNAWDEDHTGAVTIENVYNMSKKMGLNLNVDEARVLLASANKSGTGELHLDEFLDLIYNKDDVLNVDLDHLAKNLGTDYLVRREELEQGGGNLLEKLEQDAKHAREVKHMNQTNLILKNHLHKIAMNFLESDPNKAGYINFEKFEEGLKRLAINENIISSTDIKTLFEKHKNDSHTINYKDFIGMLKNFHFQFDELYKEQGNDPELRKTLGKDMAKTAEEFHIVDCRNLPYHTMVAYLGKTRKVNRAIKRLFPTKDDFYTYLSESLHVDQGKITEKYVNRKDLKGIIDTLFSHFEKVDVEKRDFEGFLSSILYNKQGDTNLQEVAKLIYEEKDGEFFDKINFKKKGPGPRRDFTEETKDEENEGQMKESIYSSRVKFQQGSLAESQATSGSIQLRDENLDRLLQKIDNQFFVGSKRAYEVFKAFDVDKDGYISRKDLALKLEDMAVMSKAEAQNVLDYVDPQNKGYVNFQEFSKKIRPNMAQQDEKGEFVVLPFVNPTKETFQKTAKTVPITKAKVKDLISTWRPEARGDDKAKTRYGASPGWSNTFLNFQAGSTSPQFMTEKDRFDRHQDARIKFQTEAKDKSKQFEEARLRNKQKFTAFISDRVENEMNAFDKLDQNRRAKKYLEQSRYEQRAKLLNSYV